MPNKKESPDEETRGEGEQQEITMADVVYRAYMEFEEAKKNLETNYGEITGHVDKLREILYKPFSLLKNKDDDAKENNQPGEFKDPQNFRTLLDALAKGIGQALEYVRMMEKAKKKISAEDLLQQLQDYLPEGIASQPEQPVIPEKPINVTVDSGKKGGVGLGGYLAARENRKMVEAYLESTQQTEPPAVTEKSVMDIIEYGKQLLPAINKVKGWFQKALARVTLFPNDRKQYWLLHEDLGTFLSKFFGTLESFISAYVQYQKGVIDGRKVTMAKALSRIAETQGMPGGAIQQGGVMMQHGAELGRRGFTERKK